MLCVPIPASPNNSIPSTNTSSPVANGATLKPPIGVSKVQVTIPEPPPSIELIPIPFELLIVIILWFTEFNPWTGAITSTSDIVWFGTFANNEVSSTTTSFSGSYTIISGALRYSLPPSVTVTETILSKLSILTTGETNASGLNVLSEEYS